MSLEQEAKRMLMERLDDCLKVHADLLDSQDIGSIYELQDLAQLHYYLKVEHPFTPAEVEALLSFQDPLEVARWCKEENTHAHSFPICELLNEIRAYERFEPAPKQDERPARPLPVSVRRWHRTISAFGNRHYPGAGKGCSMPRVRLPHCPILSAPCFPSTRRSRKKWISFAIHPPAANHQPVWAI